MLEALLKKLSETSGMVCKLMFNKVDELPLIGRDEFVLNAHHRGDLSEQLPLYAHHRRIEVMLAYLNKVNLHLCELQERLSERGSISKDENEIICNLLDWLRDIERFDLGKLRSAIDGIKKIQTALKAIDEISEFQLVLNARVEQLENRRKDKGSSTGVLRKLINTHNNILRFMCVSSEQKPEMSLSGGLNEATPPMPPSSNGTSSSINSSSQGELKHEPLFTSIKLKR